MKPLAALCLFAVCVPGILAQTTPGITNQMPDPNAKKSVRMYTPKDSDVYCAGFISETPPVRGLFITVGAEGGLKQVFNERDIVYLSRGAGFIVNPGGEYILLREITDPQHRVEWFKGQN